MIIIKIILLIWLLIMSVLDIRYGSFGKKTLLVSMAIFGIMMGIVCYFNLADWKMVLAGGAMGVLFMIISIATCGKIGMGDGYLLTVCGLVLGVYQMLILLMLAFGLSSIWGICLLIGKRATRNTKIPFAPFVCSGYGVILLCAML
ncbi:MAG: prepilin peptidase [Eubacterium sp.]|nr:prepilin peptidase [Eubacterium sp.]